ncbi:hypothetical protein VI08_13290 [Luteibacter yeojuensis]|uniref:Uncharacterized protein n=2 Tax=Luteibacter yeojuensis TaxID=345309 RepID=A0A0F3KK68_9GAMM|nr:hypothetical protein VI08_13290 [Luteibacter yeojuensis]
MTRRSWVAALLCIGLAWTWVVNGAVPGVLTPTLGQAASMLGYAQAFADKHWYTIYADSFGYPVPMPLATGLPLAWVAGWFLRLGMWAPDAYAASVAFWLAAGYLGACRFAMRLGAVVWMGALAAAAWMTTPMVWAHQGYSSLALGMAMLPLYAGSGFHALDVDGRHLRTLLVAAARLLAVCCLAIFMDGYTFVMFGVVTGMAWGARVWGVSTRRRALVVGLPICLVGFGGGIAAYRAFMGISSYDVAPLQYFRGWGLDILFAGKPPIGQFWLWDVLGWHGIRNESMFYGDASTWNTSFVLPLALAGVASMALCVGRDRRAWLLLAVAVVGFYMSLGPTLKVGSTKPPGIVSQDMPAGQGLAPTGTAFAYEHVPGVRNMRATYRWEALCFLGLWGIVTLGAAGTRRRASWTIAYLLLVVSMSPHLGTSWGDYRAFRRSFSHIDHAFAAPLAMAIPPGDRVFFAPWNNDVLVNYISPKLRISSYNVGGDKQLDIARKGWPGSLTSLAQNRLDIIDAPALVNVLLSGDADAIVIPYVNLLYGAHIWPCPAEAEGYSHSTLALFESRTDFLCPGGIRAAYQPVVRRLANEPLLAVVDMPLFAVAALRPEWRGPSGRERAWAVRVSGVSLPADVATAPAMVERMLGSGWHGPEPTLRWSSAHASLVLPEPVSCRASGCVARLQVSAFVGRDDHPLHLRLSAADATSNALLDVPLTDASMRELAIPLPRGREAVEVTLDVQGATSPAALGVSPDPRILGVGLSRIDVGPP